VSRPGAAEGLGGAPADLGGVCVGAPRRGQACVAGGLSPVAAVRAELCAVSVAGVRGELCVAASEQQEQLCAPWSLAAQSWRHGRCLRRLLHKPCTRIHLLSHAFTYFHSVASIRNMQHAKTRLGVRQAAAPIGRAAAEGIHPGRCQKFRIPVGAIWQ